MSRELIVTRLSDVPITSAPEVKTWRQHRCARRHQSVQTWLRCAVPKVVWISGHGDIALIAWCRDITVSLHESIESAEKSKSFIDRTRCGGACVNHHEIVRVVRS